MYVTWIVLCSLCAVRVKYIGLVSLAKKTIDDTNVYVTWIVLCALCAARVIYIGLVSLTKKAIDETNVCPYCFKIDGSVVSVDDGEQAMA